MKIGEWKENIFKKTQHKWWQSFLHTYLYNSNKIIYKS